ncbi:MAG: hypothetical protein WBQ94_04400 [Terracidiphilus sp.]
MTITTDEGKSPWTGVIDRELRKAVRDQVIDLSQAEELSRRLESSTREVDRAASIILRGSR